MRAEDSRGRNGPSITTVWFKYRIVGGQTRNEKVQKLTELLRKHEINSEQVQEKVVEPIDSDGRTGGEDWEQFEERKRTVVGKDCPEKDNKQFSKGYGRKDV